MKHFETSTTIQASPERVWEILTDTRSWSEWDSGVVDVDGEPAEGGRLKIRSELNPKRAYPVKVTELEPNRRMTELEPNRRMAWAGRGAARPLQGRAHLHPDPGEGEGRTRFELREEFSGPLLPLIWRTMPDMNDSFRQFASGLKERAESTD